MFVLRRKVLSLRHFPVFRFSRVAEGQNSVWAGVMKIVILIAQHPKLYKSHMFRPSAWAEWKRVAGSRVWVSA